MFSLRRLARPMGAVAAAAAAVTVLPFAWNERGAGVQQQVEDVTRRMREFLGGEDTPTLVFRKEKMDVKIFAVKGRVIPGGLGVARVGMATIEAPMRDVEDMWWHWNLRKEWDHVNTADSQLVSEIDADTRLAYIRGKPKGWSAARDFAFTACRVPPTQVGAPVQARCFVQVNSPTDVPASDQCVRGNVNSILVLEPLTQNKTRVTYCMEMDANGWISAQLMDLAADDIPLTIGVIKATLESKAKAEEDAGKTIDMIARERVREHQRAEESDSAGIDLIDDLRTSRSMLEKERRTLQDMLAKLQREEKQSGLPLTEITNKIKADLARIDRRLRG